MCCLEVLGLLLAAVITVLVCLLWPRWGAVCMRHSAACARPSSACARPRAACASPNAPASFGTCGAREPRGRQALVEYGSGSLPGEVGVDVGAAEGDTAGIPENWVLPSTPIRWLRPPCADYLGPEGPAVYDRHLFALTEPDHDPLVGQ